MVADAEALEHLIHELLHCAIGHGNPYDFVEEYYRGKIGLFVATAMKEAADAERAKDNAALPY